jgi:hypothetical protein
MTAAPSRVQTTGPILAELMEGERIVLAQRDRAEPWS